MPELFAALREDPMTRNSTVYGKDNYLKFAEKCCEVSGDDLTDFFTVYGFFEPVENYYVDDYGDYYVTTTADDIAATKAKMKTYKSGAENIIFIEDRIEYTQAEFDDATSSDMRMDYESDVAIGKCGDVGSFTDYDVNANVKASGYLYTVDNSGNVTITGDGAVGYKVYDASGNLIALYNTNSFTLPSGIASGYVIKAAQADGTCIEIPNKKGTYYTLTAYYGTADDKQTFNVTAEAPTTTVANAVIVAESANVPTAIANAANVVSTTDGTNYTMAADFTLTDKADFYSPVSFTASKLTYERTNTAGYNSVCLPFATTAADYDTDALIFSTGKLANEDNDTFIYIEQQDAADAGTPVIVYCPDDVTSWSITKENVAIAHEPVANVGTAATLLGSYTNKGIGEGFYKLNSTGTAFGITTDAGKVVAFRSYMQLNGDSDASRLAVRIADEATGINAAATDAQDDGAWYDLQGRRVVRPAKGIYIHDGHKVIVR